MPCLETPPLPAKNERQGEGVSYGAMLALSTEEFIPPFPLRQLGHCEKTVLPNDPMT